MHLHLHYKLQYNCVLWPPNVVCLIRSQNAVHLWLYHLRRMLLISFTCYSRLDVNIVLVDNSESYRAFKWELLTTLLCDVPRIWCFKRHRISHNHSLYNNPLFLFSKYNSIFVAYQYLKRLAENEFFHIDPTSWLLLSSNTNSFCHFHEDKRPTKFMYYSVF